MADIPSGTITFLFTDIEASTPLVGRLGERYDAVLDEHHRIMRAAFAAHNGHEHGQFGDGFCVAFSRASDGVAAALDGQIGLTAHEWPTDGEPRVRMGLHTGEPRLADDTYRGLAVHQAQRVCCAAHGGQVLLSRTTRDLVADSCPRTFRFVNSVTTSFATSRSPSCCTSFCIPICAPTSRHYRPERQAQDFPYRARPSSDGTASSRDSASSFVRRSP
jgi:class 3 adenylate cyclase